MAFFAILFFIFFILPWLSKLWLRNRIKKGAQAWADAINQAQQKARAEQEYSQRRPGWSDPEVRRKKIGKDVGEYVRYEEVSSTTSASYTESTDSTGRTTRTSKVETEQQVTDAEWEEI